MSTVKVYFITGANRGIGLALVNEIASKHSNVLVYAGARDPSSANALKEVKDKYPGKVEIIKYVASDVDNNKEAAKIVQSKHGYVDVVVSCAGVSSYMGPASETPVEEMRSHLEVNVTGTLVLFQVLFPLLKASRSSPKFVPLSSGAGSLVAYMAMPMGYTAYGASKAAVNYVARKIHFENEWLTCFPLNPGIVETDMAKSNRVMDASGTLAPIQDAMQISPAKAAADIITFMNSSTREKHGGEFLNADGTTIPW